jgi:hypothetical protein
MAESQNGWPVDKTGALQDRSAVAGVTFPNGVRRGDVATVLHYVAQRFHDEVQPLRSGWCWGWYVKNIEGSSSISNHASGTAIDLNAPAHPIGRRGTFTDSEERAIRRILADCDGVVRWGGDYTGRADEMHFEINKGSAAVRALANKIRGEQQEDGDGMGAEFWASAAKAARGDADATATDRNNRNNAVQVIRFALGLQVDQQSAENLPCGPDGLLEQINAKLPDGPPSAR